MKGSEQFDEMEVTLRATIRACREEDLPALEWMGLYSRHRTIIREAFEAQERGEGLMLLAVSAGFPIAQVWMSFGGSGRIPSAKLWAVRTFFPLQGAGIGMRMMRAAQRILARRGIERAELEVAPRNRKALDFYRGLGWRVAGREEEEAAGESGHILLEKELVPA
jgi:ribosomal protein S18 acetylase RimI-like enzyme